MKCPFVHGTLQEVMLTGKPQWTPSHLLKNVSFVFQMDITQDGTCPNTARVRDFYHCRFSKDESDNVIPLTRESFDPFHSPCDGAESYSERVHNSLAVANEFTAKAMSEKKGQWDGRTKHTLLPAFRCESFMCMKGMIKQQDPKAKRKLDFCDGHCSHKKDKKCRNLDLSVCNRRKKVKVNMVRILDQEELDTVQEVLGSAFAVGLTKSAPSLKATRESQKTTNRLTDAVQLNDHDQVRIVTCGNGDCNFNTRKEQAPAAASSAITETVELVGDACDKTFPQLRLTPFPGLDFQLEETSSVTNLKVSARFKKLLGSGVTARKAQNFGLLPLLPVADDSGEDPLVTEVNDEFPVQWNCVLCEVCW